MKKRREPPRRLGGKLARQDAEAMSTDRPWTYEPTASERVTLKGEDALHREGWVQVGPDCWQLPKDHWWQVWRFQHNFNTALFAIGEEGILAELIQLEKRV